jgi:hypothetical protein
VTGRPPVGEPYDTIYDWFADNGVEELLPAGAIAEVAGTQLIYSAYQWRSDRGWDFEGCVEDDDGFPAGEFRVVPLLAPVTDRLRAAAAHAQAIDGPAMGFTLVERNRTEGRPAHAGS